MNKTLNYIILTYCIILYSCGLYSSYTDSQNIPKTISIGNISNNVKLFSTELDYFLKLALQDKLSKQEDYTLEQKNGDFNIDGNISNYQNKVVAIKNNKAIINRVSIDVTTSLNNKIEKITLTKHINVFADYNSKQNLNKIRDSIEAVLVEKAVDKIYSHYFMNW